MKTGFLPEPIPAVAVSQNTINELSKIYTNMLGMPTETSPIFADAKESEFLLSCKGLSVEQAVAQFHSVFTDGLDKSSIAISKTTVRAIAKRIGEEVAGATGMAVLSDPRLFGRWIRGVIVQIANDHFKTPVQVALDVEHLDLPNEPTAYATIAIYLTSLWDSDKSEYVERFFLVNFEWPGRHVVSNVWIDYIVYLMRKICSLSD